MRLDVVVFFGSDMYIIKKGEDAIWCLFTSRCVVSMSYFIVNQSEIIRWH